MANRQKIEPCLWFDGRAVEAVNFYVSVFPNSRVLTETVNPLDWPGGRAGGVVVVVFELDGQRYQALNGGPFTEFNDAVSFSVMCENQAEIDRYWDALTADGGAPIACGWLKDKYGVRWQIVPKAIFDMFADPDPERRKRVMTAMYRMVKLDIAALETAYDAQ